MIVENHKLLKEASSIGPQQFYKGICSRAALGTARLEWTSAKNLYNNNKNAQDPLPTTDNPYR